MTRLVDTVREKLNARLHDWGWNWEHSDWSNWKTFSPAAGSAIVHIAVFGALLGVTTAFSEHPPAPQARVMEVTLVAETPPPPPPELVAPQPRAPAPSQQAAETLPDRAPAPAPRRRSAEASSASAPTSTTEGVYLPPSPLKPGTAGLASLMGSDDPCRTTDNLRVKDCGTEFAGKIKEAAAYAQMSAADQEKFYGDFTFDCPFRAGCSPEWRGLNGLRSMAKPPPGSRDDRGGGTPMAGGAAGLGGLHDSIGRLGFNPDHTDPGFGD